jgi:hypothetical protein
MSGTSVTPSRLRAWAPSVVLAAGVLAIWAVFTWPLPRHFGDGIASSSHNREAGAVRRMIPGDHLQLLYHYWLAGDLLAGRTPWFHNLYEFNTGDDSECFRVHAQYAPFSWLFAAISAVAGRAAGMNLTGLVSLGLTAWLTMRLARRYAADDALAVLAGWLSILMPYRWIMLLGGSPMGHAITWVPLLLLGVDMVVRDLRPAGGFLVGLGLLFASWGDSHVLFFGVFACAGWVAVAIVARGGWPWRDGRAWRALAGAAGAALVGLVPALVMLAFTVTRLRGTTAGVTRNLSEIALFSPRLSGLFQWAASGVHSHLYLGWSLCALAALGMAGWIACRPRSPEAWRRLAVFLLLLAAVVAVIVLASGPHGPHGGVAWRAARKLIPPYRAIRQPAKVLCLLPTLAAVGLAAGLSAWTGLLRRPAARSAACALLALAVAAEMKAQIHATICTLDGEQGAYRAVADRARADGLDPRVLVLPLWPGDAAYCSVYQHYASLYRVRMANGYSPAVRPSYIEGFFGRFKDFNHGEMPDASLDALLGMGIRAILFHEDQFPEKVSPFPAGRTLEALRRHPRLRFLAQDGRVWAFEILAPGAARPDAGAIEAYADPWPPARRSEIERGVPHVTAVADPACSHGAYGGLAREGDRFVLPRVPPHGEPEVAWWLRVRGDGELSLEWSPGADEEGPRSSLRVDSGAAWVWLRMPPPDGVRDRDRVTLSAAWASGRADVDVALFATAGPLALKPGESRVFPAAAFFRAGSTAAGGAVVFDPERDPADRVLYGPFRPLVSGRYRATLEFGSPAAPGLALGSFVVDGADAPPAPVAVGRPAEVEFVQVADTPFVASITYSRAASVTIQRLVLLRLE